MFLAVGGVTAGMMVFNIARCIAERDTDPQVSMEALKVQQQLGWNTGQVGARLAFGPELNLRDVDGQGLRTEAMTSLWTALRPLQPAWAPYYVPTLFKSLSDERSGELRAQMQPVHTDAMDQAFRRGEGLDDVFGASGAPDDVALIIDLPGPEAVALAAALSARFEPVWLFDNWPHPRGVVPSHETLAAALYYLPILRRGTDSRHVPAPPAFVLDADRLNPYRDEVEHFDNRYTVELPSAARLQLLGVSRVLYVRGGDGALESDDLNEDFAELDRSGIPVRQVSLGDFQAASDGPNVPDAGAPATASGSTHRRYYYGGGGSWSHVYFWHSYGWYSPTPPRGAPSRVPPPAPPPSRASSYRPVARQTIFSSRAVGGAVGIGKTKPSGFGRISVRTARATGATSVGRGRSGSFGRGSFSSG